MNKIDFNKLNEVINSAPMTEKNNIISNIDNKKKLINMPVEWENKIKESYRGTINSYIMMAIFERMQKDGLIK